jgi:hypothetical protein
MLRKCYKVIARLSPSLSSMLREFYFTLNGWRFIDLKTHIDRIATGFPATLSLEHSFREAIGGGPDPDRIAFLTNLPPDTTGIATCSFYSWLGHAGPVDLFCPVVDVDWFLGNGLRLKAASQNRIRVLDVRAFITADQINRYKSVVIAAGNSIHCLFIHDVLRKAAAFGGLERFVLYAHDPCLLNLIQRGTMSTPTELRQTLEDIYSRRLRLEIADLASDAALHAALVRGGVLGMRYFLNAGIKRYLVNSKTAFNVVTPDLGSRDAKVREVFHPVFLPANPSDALAIVGRRAVSGANGPLTIGTFGIPGPSKLTERIVAATHTIQRRGIDVSLIIAGFGVRGFAQTRAGDLAGINVKLFDGPADVQLLHCMAKVDVAVQLRLRNLGESSGIVPQLLALGKSVLVSDIGTFNELGSAVRTIPVDANASQIAEAILDAWRRPVPQESIREYVKTRTPAHFRDVFLAALSDLA